MERRRRRHPDALGYDSRQNQILTVDPKGNTALAVVDGALRGVQTQRHLRIAGQGANPPVADQSNAALARSTGPVGATGSFLPAAAACIVTTSILDGNDRLKKLVDDRGSNTFFGYDTLDRQFQMTFHDGSTRVNVFDLAGDVTTYTDENGSRFTNVFDPLGRKAGVGIVCASGVVGTTAQAFQFDGISRMTQGVRW